jgi:hypothetical protein
LSAAGVHRPALRAPFPLSPFFDCGLIVHNPTDCLFTNGIVLRIEKFVAYGAMTEQQGRSR